MSKNHTKTRKDLADSESSDDEESSKSSDEESTGKKRKNSHSSDSESDNEQEKPQKKRRVTHSLSEDSDNSANEMEVDENVASGSFLPTQEHQPPPIAMITEMDDNKSDLEEGQISSDTDTDASESSSNSEFTDGYGDDLMGNEEDRNNLEKLSEKERETELFKRAERRDQLKRRWEIERKLKQSRKVENAAKKKDKKPKIKKVKTVAAKKVMEKPPKAMPAPATSMTREEAITSLFAKQSQSQSQPDEDSQGDFAPDEFFDAKERSKERKKNVEMNKTDDKRSSAMAMLKARREGKQKRDIERNEAANAKSTEDEKEELTGVSEKSSTKLNTSDVYSDSDSDSEEKQSPSRRSSSSRSTSSDTEDDKSQAKAVYKKPVYVSTLEEMNKLRISRHKLECYINLPIFEKTVIGGFVRINIGNNAVSGKLVYRVAEIIGVVETAKIYQFGTCRTNKGIRLKHGAQERVFRLEFVSNQDFSTTEFEAWREVCATSDVDLPNIDMIEQKRKDLQAAANYEFKEEDIDRIIEEKNRFRAYPTNYAMRKTQLMKERDEAIHAGNEELANEINTKIQELEERANALDKKRTSSISLISYINNRNRRMNIEEAEKAIIEEARLNKGQKFQDPFTRRSTKPTMAFKSKPAQQQEEIMLPPEAPKPNKQKEKKTEDHTSGDNLYSLHDFEIDLDMQMPLQSIPAAVPKPVEKSQDGAPKLRRSLNLEDYKKKRGLI